MKKNKVLGLGLLSLIIIIIIISSVFFIKNTQIDDFNAKILQDDTTMLLWSLEYSEYKQSSKTNTNHILSFLLIFDGTTNKIGILEIPAKLAVYDDKKSLYVPIEHYYINHGYTQYYNALLKIIGVNSLKYIFMDNTMLSNFVDMIGGIQLFIIEEEEASKVLSQNSVDNTVQIGNVNLDGPDVMKYLNNIEQSDSTSLLNASKRKELITSFLKGLQTNVTMFSNKKILKRFFSIIHTSLSQENMLALNDVIPTYPIDKLFYQRINGIIRKVMLDGEEKSILFINSEVGSISKIVDFFQKQIRNSAVALEKNKVTISILNGTVINGLARRVKEAYQAAGFQVISVGNASRNDIKKTSIIDRVGNKVSTELAAQVIGVRNIITDISTVDSSGANITLILGEDFDGERVIQ